MVDCLGPRVGRGRSFWFMVLLTRFFIIDFLRLRQFGQQFGPVMRVNLHPTKGRTMMIFSEYDFHFGIMQ